MSQRALKIQNKLGLHARPASLFVSEALKYKSQIFISKDGERLNGKSIMGILMLAAGKGSTIIIEAEGEDAEKALDGLEDLVVRRKFDEE
jgi:phosphotransferase system HPr (HPr) family protein